MKLTSHMLAAATLLTPLATALAAGEKILVADRDLDVVWMLHDANSNGTIEDSEVSLFWSGANASGTPVPGTWTAMAIRADGRIGVGDSTQRFVMSMHDFNHDGDAQDVGESWVVATNTTWNCFGSPSGIAFDTRGTMFVNNSGNGGVPVDGIFKLTDLNADGDCEDTVDGVPERGEYCVAPPIGPGNTAYVPFEMTYAGGSLYHRDSGSGVQGVWKTTDLNDDGDANDPGEFVGFAINGNASSFTFTAGLVVEPDLASERALYTIQVVSGADQLIRVVDVNDDGDAMDAGEITLVYSTAEANYSPTDILCLPDGSVLIGDSTGKKIYRLSDANNDGLFDQSERSTWFNNAALTVSDFRRLVLVPAFCPADLDSGNGAGIPDGGVDINDLLFFLTKFEEGATAADLDNDGQDPAQPDGGVDINDLLFFLTHFESGC